MARWISPACIVSLAVATVAVADLPRAEALAATTGVTYYLSPSGDDRDDGTSPETAWRTLDRAGEATFEPADRLLLEGGETFSGTLRFSPGEGGTPAEPISVSSYGNGRATIDGGAGTAIFVHDAGGLVLSRLELVGSGSETNAGSGVNFYNDLAGTPLHYVRVQDVEARGFREGIAIGGLHSGYRDVHVVDAALHHNRDTGLLVYGPPFDFSNPAYVNSDVYVGHVAAYRNSGNADNDSTNSGNGIVLGSVDGATIERSVAFGNGGLCRAPEGPVGIWTYDSRDVTIQLNESYDNDTGGQADGGGFDLDQNVSDSVVQYNYSHDNDGAGFLVFTAAANTAHRGNTVRYNISENDGRRNGYGALDIGGKVYKTAVYHNTIYVSEPARGKPSAIRIHSVGGGVTVRNNILYVEKRLNVLSAPALSRAAVTFQGNDYYSPSRLRIRWGDLVYSKLQDWRDASGQERLGQARTGSDVDPDLLDPGGGGTIGDPDELSDLTAYTLREDSPMIDAGLDLRARFGIDPGGRDFYGNLAPSGAAPDVGAHEAR